MITSYHHVELNGVKYRLAESAEGDHYVAGGEPLRPPNGQVVQGASQGQFQMRPDTLLWLIDSWAGGAGQIRFDPQNPDRMRRMYGVDGFEKPGTLRQGLWYKQVSLPATGGGASDAITRMMFPAYAFITDNSDGETSLVEWDGVNEEWDLTTDTALAATFVFSAGMNWSANPSAGDAWKTGLLGIGSSGVYYINAGAIASWATDAIFGSYGLHSDLFNLGDYVYWAATDGSEIVVLEYLATSAPGATAPTEVLRVPGSIGTFTEKGHFVGGGNRAYLSVTRGGDSLIYEIIPTTAAGAASGSLLVKMEALAVTAVHYSEGLLYMGTDRGAVYYLQPGASYGLIKTEEEDTTEDRGIHSFASTEQFVYALLAELDSGSTYDASLLRIDKVTGAYEEVSVVEGERTGGRLIGAVSRLRDGTDTDKFERIWTGGVDETFFASDRASTTESGYALTPWHNFGVSENKQLMSLRVRHDMTDDWQLNIYARKDGDETETLLDTITGTGGPDETIIVPSSAYAFGQLSLRTEFVPNLGDSAAIPTVTSIEVRATVTQEQRMWRLLLDCADDETGVAEGVSGATKIANIEALAASGAPFTFKDGYQNREVGVSDSSTVVVDSYQILLDRPGEGVATVILREQS